VTQFPAPTGVAGCELELLLCRVSVVFAELWPQQVQQAQFVAAGDLLPQHRGHDVLEIVVVDFPDRLETDGTGGHVEHLLEHGSSPLCAQGDHQGGCRTPMARRQLTASAASRLYTHNAQITKTFKAMISSDHIG
jgi:hypothetical protein